MDNEYDSVIKTVQRVKTVIMIVDKAFPVERVKVSKLIKKELINEDMSSE